MAPGKKFVGFGLLALGAVGAYLYYKGKQAAAALKGCDGCTGDLGRLDDLAEAQKYLAAQKYPTQDYDVVERVDQATGLSGLAAMDMANVFGRVDPTTTVEHVPATGLGVAATRAFRPRSFHKKQREVRKLQLSRGVTGASFSGLMAVPGPMQPSDSNYMWR